MLTMAPIGLFTTSDGNAEMYSGIVQPCFLVSGFGFWVSGSGVDVMRKHTRAFQDLVQGRCTLSHATQRYVHSCSSSLTVRKTEHSFEKWLQLLSNRW